MFRYYRKVEIEKKKLEEEAEQHKREYQELAKVNGELCEKLEAEEELKRAIQSKDEEEKQHQAQMEQLKGIEKYKMKFEKFRKSLHTIFSQSHFGEEVEIFVEQPFCFNDAIDLWYSEFELEDDSTSPWSFLFAELKQDLTSTAVAKILFQVAERWHINISGTS